MDQMPTTSPAMPPHSDSDMPMSHMDTHMDATHEAKSLIKPQVIKKAKRPIFLWLVVVLLLGGTGFLGYMVYSQQNTLVAFQDSFTKWTNQVNTLQSSYDSSLRSVNDKLITLETTSTTIQENLELMKTARTAEPTPTEEPGVMEEPGMMTGSGSEVMEPAGGTFLSEADVYESFLTAISEGQEKTAQPDGITLVKSRQVSADGKLSYNVFSSKDNPADLYLYIQKLDASSVVEDGWYGPFNLAVM